MDGVNLLRTESLCFGLLSSSSSSNTPASSSSSGGGNDDNNTKALQSTIDELQIIRGETLFNITSFSKNTRMRFSCKWKNSRVAWLIKTDEFPFNKEEIRP